MRTLTSLLAALVVSLSLVGCGAATTSLKPYVPQTFSVEGTRATLVEQVVDLANEQGWKILLADRARGHVLARTVAAETVPGTVERETWTFDANENALLVSRKLEVRGERETWLTTDVVCRDYAYATEALLVDQLRDHLAHRGDARLPKVTASR